MEPYYIALLFATALSTNVALGAWRSGLRKFSPAWFAAIHASIPLLVAMRLSLIPSNWVIPPEIGLAMLGQFVGARVPLGLRADNGPRGSGAARLAGRVVKAVVPVAAPPLLFLLLFVACGSDGEEAPETASPTAQAGTASYQKIGPAELKAMLVQKDFPLVNVHIPYEGEIAPTDMFIPYDEIEQHLDELPSDTGAKIVLYCRSGRMSTIAAEALVRFGYTNIWELEGGMIAWAEAGHPVVEDGP